MKLKIKEDVRDVVKLACGCVYLIKSPGGVRLGFITNTEIFWIWNGGNCTGWDYREIVESSPDYNVLRKVDDYLNMEVV